MKVRVYCRNFATEVPEKTIWRGEMDCVPRKGELLCFSDMWRAEEVEEVYYSLKNQLVHVRIQPDFDDDYEEVK